MRRYIESVDRFVTKVQKYYTLFELIDCEIGVTSE